MVWNGLQKNTEFGINMKIKNIKIEIDSDVADGIVRASLIQNIYDLREDIAALKKIKKLKEYQRQDLADYVIALNAVEEVFDYYGGNLK